MERNQIVISEEMIRQQYNYMEKVRILLGDAPRKAAVMTFGCQQNEADSERLAGMLHEMGYSIVKDPEDVDLILVNTCAVREHAELKTLSITGQYKHLKQKNPSLLIGICGCMVSQEHRKEDIKQKYPYVDFLFGTEGLYKFPEILYNKLHSGKRQFSLNEGIGNIAEGLPVYRDSNFKAWVSIMYGCNNFCSYCIVPYVRGRERSRDPEKILAEVRELAESGVKEITLLGQNVNSYGKDLPEPMEFAALLEMVCAIPGDFTVRFMTSHPKDATKRLIDVMAENDKIAKAFHLPLQSGSDRILKIMNRKYTKQSYLDLAHYIKEKMPDISLTTDIIVGFPGENDEDFADTLAVLSEVRFDNIYSFIYSKRVGTPAASMPDQVPGEISQRRFAEMLKLQDEISLSKNRENIGKVLTVLVEGPSKTDPDRLTGRTEKGRLVHFKGPDSLIGKNANVRIKEVQTHSFFGELI